MPGKYTTVTKAKALKTFLISSFVYFAPFVFGLYPAYYGRGEGLFTKQVERLKNDHLTVTGL